MPPGPAAALVQMVDVVRRLHLAHIAVVHLHGDLLGLVRVIENIRAVVGEELHG